MTCATLSRRFAAVLGGAALLLVTAASIHAQGLTPEDVLRLQSVGAVALSPDGRLVAYTVSRPRSAEEAPGAAFSEIRVVPVTGGAERVLVEPPRAAHGIAWSPDGRTVSYIARIEELDPQPQVWGVSPEGGEPRALTRSREGVLAYEWSPDGRRIAYTAREPEPGDAAARRAQGFDMRVSSDPPRHVRLFVEDLGGARRVGLTPDQMTVRSFAWAPDSRSLALQMTDRTDIDADYMYRRLYVVRADDTGPPRPLTATQGKLGDMDWSPDGRHLAFLGATSLNDPLAQSVFVVPATGGDAVNLTPHYEGSATTVTWLDARSVLFLASEGTRTTLNRVPATGGRIQRVAGGSAEVIGSLSLDAAGGTFAVNASTATHPPEVFVGTMARPQLRRVTAHNAFLADVRLARQETVAWTGPGGFRIEGVLIRPLDERPGMRYPLAVLPHGGPEGVSLDGWTTNPLYPAQVLAARGYAVLMPNYRASGGRGVAFSKADHRDLGGPEFGDVLAGIDHLAATGLVDAQRVGISGTSYGGYFSAWAATKHSDRFRAAIPFAGISNWVSFTGTTDIPEEMSLVHWDMWWWDDPELAWMRSPLAYINQARTPTLIGHGLADDRVHPAQSMELHQALELKGVPTELVLYPREPHGLRERAHQLDFMQRVIAWFDRYLKGDTATD